VIRKIESSVHKIANAQGVQLETPLYCEVVENVIGFIGYATGSFKKNKEITLPPEPSIVGKVRSYGMHGLLSDAVERIWERVREKWRRTIRIHRGPPSDV